MSKLCKNIKSKKEIKYVLVRCSEHSDSEYNIIKRSDLLEPLETDLEENAIYNALINSSECMVEFLYFGSKSDCEEIQNKNLLVQKKIKTLSKQKNLIKESNGNDVSCEPSTSNGLKKPNQIKEINKKTNVYKDSTVEDGSTDSYAAQIDERNKLITSLKSKNQELEKIIDTLREELNMYKRMAGISNNDIF
ncbi:unnamed protein product [Brachionus calyciflorus]|uniref:Uncharacterized protein n=1 Tax=Brachionus calyciflorus TaxID=104777 RepID=A0A814Q923_9BILA|nr:unnamed protein product [Brachionus calyciflorus]